MCISSVVHWMRVMLLRCKWVSLSSTVEGHPRGLDLVLTIRLHHDRESQGGLKLMSHRRPHTVIFIVFSSFFALVLVKCCAIFDLFRLFSITLRHVSCVLIYWLCWCCCSCCSSVISSIAVFCVFQVGCWCQLYPSKLSLTVQGECLLTQIHYD